MGARAGVGTDDNDFSVGGSHKLSSDSSEPVTGTSHSLEGVLEISCGGFST